MVYSDGSGYEGKIGAAAVLYKRGTTQELSTLKYHLGDHTRHTTYEAEAVGAILATWLLQRIPDLAWSSASIYTDNQALIRSSTKRATNSGHYLAEAFRAAADNLPCRIHLKWISGHSEVKGNETADTLAKEAASGQSSPITQLPPLLHHPLPYSATAEKQAYTSEINAMWQEQWLSSPRRARMERIDKFFPYNKFRKILNGLTRAQSSLLIQIRSGHIPLNAHLFKLKCIDTDKCQACLPRRGAIPARETITHFLFECPAYAHERFDFERALGRQSKDLELIMACKKRIRELLRFVSRTERLKKSFGDLTQSDDEDV